MGRELIVVGARFSGGSKGSLKVSLGAFSGVLLLRILGLRSDLARDGVLDVLMRDRRFKSRPCTMFRYDCSSTKNKNIEEELRRRDP